MLETLHTYFNIENLRSKSIFRKRNKPNYALRDAMDKKKSTNKLKKGDNKVPEAVPVPLVQKEKEAEKEGIEVKILMTKEEAARLLSKCKDGGVLEFKDLARELVQIPASRVSVVSSCKAEDRVLGSIPEEPSTAI